MKIVHRQDILRKGLLADSQDILDATREIEEAISEISYRELVPYLPLWESVPYDEGVIFIIVVEHDGLKEGIARIPKGTDGRALL
jgi:hypothetical protein